MKVSFLTIQYHRFSVDGSVRDIWATLRARLARYSVALRRVAIAFSFSKIHMRLHLSFTQEPKSKLYTKKLHRAPVKKTRLNQMTARSVKFLNSKFCHN